MTIKHPAPAVSGRTDGWSKSRNNDLGTTVGQDRNRVEYLASLLTDGRIPARRVYGMLALRSSLTFAMLLTVAGVFALSGNNNPIAASSAWWLWFVTLTNIVCILLMVRLGRLEGIRLRDIYFVNGATWRQDLWWAILAFAVTAVIAQPPGNWLAALLWGDAGYPNKMLIQALPLTAIYPLFVLMPTTQALAELPIYWGYVAPRLRAVGVNRWLVILLVGSVLSLQHMFFSFQFDWRYDLWLAVKFLPFAIWTGIIIERRPSTLPYLMVAHFALDATLPLLVFLVSNGTMSFN